MHHYKNPQENAILERIHKVVSSMLRTKDLDNVKFDAVSLWSDILASITFAARYSYHSTLQTTPGKSLFGNDMLLDIYFQPNYKEMWLRKQKLSIIIISMKTQSERNTTMRLATTCTF